MATARLALMWHHHQPFYTDPVTAQPSLPWVRLHAIKDYWGMARLLERAGGMRATINLVPSLLDQVEAYADGSAVDPHLAIARKRTDELTESEILFMLDNFFSANWDTMVRPVPRFAELLGKRSMHDRPAAQTRKAFTTRDLRDLSILYDLVWFHPLLREEDEGVRALWEKGGSFSEQDRALLLDRERAVIADVIPLHRRLQESGQIELTTTPYCHPILPLLIDFSSIHEAMPNAPVPPSARSLRDDAALHVAGALSSHARRFGARPRGMWPSEGAVSQHTAELLIEQGVEWIATDEQILERSVGFPLGRYGESLGRPDALYRPYELRCQHGMLRMVFRDHYLSDLIGFQYRSWNGASAAYDLLGKVAAVGRGWRSPGEPLVSIILDGENAWEHYPNQGIEFLSTLYHGAAAGGEIRPVRIGDAVREPPSGALPRLFAGSWIDHNFNIWGGQEEDRAGWDLVYQCRRALDALGVPEESPARNELRIAEGSDWFWWFGDDHSCANDAEFDRLFRAHVRAAYTLAGLPAPTEVEKIIKRRARQDPYTAPGRLLSVTVDGTVSDYFEWLSAGVVEDGDAMGVMDLPRSHLIKKVLFGCDLKHLFVRVDFREANEKPDGECLLRVVVLRPHEAVFVLPLAGVEPSVTREGSPERVGRAAMRRILEVALPWSALGVSQGERVDFFVQRISNGQPVERTPREGAVSVTVPRDEDVAWDWSA